MQKVPSRDGDWTMAAAFKVLTNTDTATYANFSLTATLRTTPKHLIRYQPSNPFKILQNFFRLKALLSLDGEEMLKYEMSYKLNPQTRLLFRKMISSNPAYEALYPLVKQCREDLTHQLNHSLACFHSWNTLNVLNQWDHQITFSTSAPGTVLKWARSLMKERLRKNPNMQVIEDDTIWKERHAESTYRVSIVTSPFNARESSVDWEYNGVGAFVPRNVHPRQYVTTLLPTDRDLYSPILRQLTGSHYPGMCYIHHDAARGLHIQTFDGLQYKLTNESISNANSKQILLVQDVDQTFQISLTSQQEKQIVQIVAQNFSKPIQMIRVRSRGVSQIRVDNALVKQMPVTFKNKKGDVLLLLRQLDDYVIGKENAIHMSFPLLGVDIKTDLETFIHIQASPFYHSSLRGICGDFDGETYQDMKTTDCKRFLLRPEDVFRVPGFSRPLKQELSSDWISLKPCDGNKLLMPLIA